MHLHILLTKKREWGGGQNNWLEKDHFAFFLLTKLLLQITLLVRYDSKVPIDALTT